MIEPEIHIHLAVASDENAIAFGLETARRLFPDSIAENVALRSGTPTRGELDEIARGSSIFRLLNGRRRTIVVKTPIETAAISAIALASADHLLAIACAASAHERLLLDGERDDLMATIVVGLAKRTDRLATPLALSLSLSLPGRPGRMIDVAIRPDADISQGRES
jgi:hypothetical protein